VATHTTVDELDKPDEASEVASDVASDVAWKYAQQNVQDKMPQLALNRGFERLVCQN
jgi:hypothetical protein